MTLYFNTRILIFMIGIIVGVLLSRYIKLYNKNSGSKYPILKSKHDIKFLSNIKIIELLKNKN